MIRRIWDITLTVADLSRAVDFYQGTLGLPLKYRFVLSCKHKLREVKIQYG